MGVRARATRIAGCSVRLGRECESSSLAGVAASDKERLERSGLLHFSRCTREELLRLAFESARDALSKSRVEPDAVDRVIWATSDFAQEHDRNDLASLARDLGLKDPGLLGVSQGFCSNVTLAFEVADALLATEKSEVILLVTLDRYWSDAARVLRNGAGLGGDGAGACVLSRRALSGYEVLSTAHVHSRAALDAIGSDQLVRYVRAYSDGYALACRRALGAAAVEASRCARLVTPNFAGPVLRSLAELAGFEPARVGGRRTRSDVHANAADQLGALAELEELLPNGEVLLVTGAGDHVWGAATLRRAH